MPTSSSRHSSLFRTYEERATLPNTSALASYLYRLIAAKKTNLCVSADVTSTAELLRLAEEVGDSICLLKTHADIIQDFGHKTMQGLTAIARTKGFLIFEDRKFGDIGSTVQKQYTAGPLQIVRWANIINCHIFPGPAIITALHSAANDAVAAYTTSVETQISGPDSDSIAPDDDDDSPLPLGSDSPNDFQDGDRLSSDEEEDSGEDAAEDVAEAHDATPLALDPDSLGRRLSSQNNLADRTGRKLSVVSVTTTLSTKTESISPAPSSPNQTRSINAQVSSSSPTGTDWAAAQSTLGAPPMARALLLLAQMSSAGNLMDAPYTAACVAHARANPEFVMGFIAQKTLNTQPGDNFVIMTPGVQIGSSGDGLGQQYNSPEKVVGELGTDVVIVGRGVYGAADRARAAEEYRVRSWNAYEARVAGKKN